MSAQDLVDGLPIEPLPLDAMGVPPLPAPPQPPSMTMDPKAAKTRKLMAAAALLGAAVGGRATTGFGRGMLDAFRVQDRQREIDQEQAQRQYEQQADTYRYAAAEQQRLAAERAQLYARNIEQLRSATLAQPDRYDDLIAIHTAGLQQLGFRVDANSLRRAVPKMRKDIKQVAEAAWKKWYSANEAHYKADPLAATMGVIPMDRDQDGFDEDVPVWEAGLLAGILSRGPTGQPLFVPKDVPAKQYAVDVNGRFNLLIDQDRADGKRMTPALMMQRQDEAETWAREQARLTAEATREPKTGTGSTADELSDLVAVVMDNPALFRQFTPTTQERIAPALGSRGFDFSRSAGTPSMKAGVTRLATSLGMLETLDTDLTQATGLRGRAAGTAQKWWARLTGEDTPATLYTAISDSLLPALARSSGEVGNLAEREQTRYAKLAPSVSDPKNIRQAKYAAIRYIIDAAVSGASADELSPFLDYLQFMPAPGSDRQQPPTGGAGTIGPYSFREVR